MNEYDETIVRIAGIFNDLKIPSVVVGASARDIFCNEFGLPKAIRKTSDVDFGIFVKSWDELRKVEESLKNNPKIEKKGEKDNKVRYHYDGTPFDIVPFGGIEKEGKVSWPPFYDTIMTVIGYEEALRHAVPVKIGGTEIKVVCVEILIALKLIAWNENRSRQKDISDSWFIISQYSKIDPTSYEYVVDNYLELLSQFDHEVEFAEALHIGIKQKKLLKAEAHEILKNILENEDNLSRIATIALEGKQSEDIEKEEASVKRHFQALLAALKDS